MWLQNIVFKTYKKNWVRTRTKNQFALFTLNMKVRQNLLKQLLSLAVLFLTCLGSLRHANEEYDRSKLFSCACRQQLHEWDTSVPRPLLTFSCVYNYYIFNMFAGRRLLTLGSSSKGAIIILACRCFRHERTLHVCGTCMNIRFINGFGACIESYFTVFSPTCLPIKPFALVHVFLKVRVRALSIYTRMCYQASLPRDRLFWPRWFVGN